MSALFASLGALKEIESLIELKLSSEAPVIEEACEYLLKLGGKRVRPVLVLLCARALGLEEPFQSHLRGQQLLEVASGIELIHMATLLHDDIIDKSPLRRHKTSPYSKFGSDATLLSGDFLLVRAFGVCARLERFIIEATERACIALTEGEVVEVDLLRSKHTLESSLEVARKKTAALFKLAAECAAWLATDESFEQRQEVVRKMGAFGENLGIVFQIVDDILDVISTEDLLGKKTGQDIHERKPSVLNLLWLASGSPLAQRLLTPIAADESEFVASALAELRASAVVKNAQDLARQYSEKALSELAAAYALIPFASTASKHMRESALAHLRQLNDYVLERMT